jgi:hypothetical protein
MDEASFVERRLELKGGDVIICRFFQPALVPADGPLHACHRCTWEVTWPTRQVRRKTVGEDAVQALLLAMQSAHWEVVSGAEYAAGEIVDFDPVDGNHGLLALPSPASDPLP